MGLTCATFSLLVHFLGLVEAGIKGRPPMSGFPPNFEANLHHCSDSWSADLPQVSGGSAPAGRRKPYRRSRKRRRRRSRRRAPRITASTKASGFSESWSALGRLMKTLGSLHLDPNATAMMAKTSKIQIAGLGLNSDQETALSSFWPSWFVRVWEQPRSAGHVVSRSSQIWIAPK